MKKLVIVLVVALAAAGMAVAQGAPGPVGPPGWYQSQTQIVKAEGKLSLINGMVGLKSGGKTYYVPMLGRLSGFVEGLKEGASVKLEGYEYQLPYAPEYSTLMVTKLTFGGKDYDFSQLAHGRMGFGWGGGMMGGRHW